MKDLIGLVADKKMEAGVAALLRRAASFQIRPITTDVYRHPHHDSGVLLEAADFLQVFRNSHQHAIVFFDREGCGQDALEPDELKRSVQAKLDAKGWHGRSDVVVLNPELEAWVWSDSPHVADVLGVSYQELRTLMAQNTPEGKQKPSRPKELMESAIRKAGVPMSASLYSALARTVGVERCTDPAFLHLRNVLTGWFPLGGANLAPRR
jgi:hypothetical protein